MSDPNKDNDTSEPTSDDIAKKNREAEELEKLFADFDPKMAEELEKEAKKLEQSSKGGGSDTAGSGGATTSDGADSSQGSPFDNLFGGFDISSIFGADFPTGPNPLGAVIDPWQNMRRTAAATATGGVSEDNIDPAERIKYETLARVAELAITSNTSLTLHHEGKVAKIRPVTRHEWALSTADDYKGLMSALSKAMSEMLSEGLMGDSLPFEQMEAIGLPSNFVAEMAQKFGPLLFSSTAGSATGRLTHRLFGSYDLPIPRPANSDLLVLSANINDFANEWNIKAEDVWLWVCFHEYLSHAILSKAHIAELLNSLIIEYVSGFKADPQALETALDGEEIVDASALLNNPEKLIGAFQTDAQRQTMDRISTLISAVAGYIDYMMDHLCTPYMSQYSMMAEAIRRRRITADISERSLERLLGFTLDRSCYNRGRDFIDGVVERSDISELEKLFESVENLPTPNELEAPGLWLARISL